MGFKSSVFPARPGNNRFPSDLRVRERTARSCGSIILPTVKPLDDPHTSGTRSEQGLPTPRCLCEEGSYSADLPFLHDCSRAHCDTGMTLPPRLVSLLSQLANLDAAG